MYSHYFGWTVSFANNLTFLHVYSHFVSLKPIINFHVWQTEENLNQNHHPLGNIKSWLISMISSCYLHHFLYSPLLTQASIQLLFPINHMILSALKQLVCVVKLVKLFLIFIHYFNQVFCTAWCFIFVCYWTFNILEKIPNLKSNNNP